ncbi:MAG: site-specific integrase [Thermoplasmata archaeon]|jgi:site-specific recombinase XerD|nr:site-specific integrase [Thermoplasmata archaeon]
MRYQFKTDVNAFIAEMRPHYSPSTIKNKERKMSYIAGIFTDLYKDKKVSTCNPRKIKQKDLEVYVTKRRNDGIADSTLSKELCFINQLCKWVGNDVVEKFRFFGGIYKPHAYTGRKDGMSDELIKKVIELGRTTEDWRVLQGCAAVLLCSSSGLRPQEARQMYASDITMMNGVMMVHIEHVKGEGTWGKPRTILLMDGVEDIIQRYLDVRKQKLEECGKTSDSLFPPIQNENEFYCQQKFCNLKKCVETIVGEKFELRAGRRSYGQRLLNKGNRLEDVSVAMGHCSTRTTELYYARAQEMAAMGRIYQNKDNKEAFWMP